MQNVHYCHHCAAKVVPNSKYCNKCGTSLASLSNKPEPPPTPKPNFVAPSMSGEPDEDDDGLSVQSFDLRLNALAVDIGGPDINLERMSFQMGEAASKKKRGRPAKS